MNKKPFAEFIIFLDGLSITKSMIYSEFEAVLDGMIGLGEFACQTRKAAYLTLHEDGHIDNVVLFLASFDESGNPHIPHLPLRHLAKQAYPWASIDNHVINLTCSYQCPDLRVVEFLWGIEEDEVKSFVHELAQWQNSYALKNTLDFNPYAKPNFTPASMSQSPSVKAMHSHQFSYGFNDIVANTEPSNKAENSGYKDKFHSLQKRLIELQAEQKSQHLQFKNYLLKLKLNHQKQVSELNGIYQHNLQQLKSEIDEQKDQFIELSDKHYQSQREIDKLTTSLKEHKTQKKELSKELQQQEQYHAELERNQSQLDNALEEINQLKEQLAYYKAQEYEHKKLKREVKDLSMFKPEILSKKMDELSIVLVHIHPVAGHMSINATDFVRFLKDPSNYIANRFGVSKHLYQQWLTHSQKPQCSHPDCHKLTAQVSQPNRFTPGDSDRCGLHREINGEDGSLTA